MSQNASPQLTPAQGRRLFRRAERAESILHAALLAGGLRADLADLQTALAAVRAIKFRYTPLKAPESFQSKAASPKCQTRRKIRD